MPLRERITCTLEQLGFLLARKSDSGSMAPSRVNLRPHNKLALQATGRKSSAYEFLSS